MPLKQFPEKVVNYRDWTTATALFGGASNDYLSHPTDSGWKFFCDFFQVTPDLGSNDGNNQFWMMGGGSGISPQDEVSSNARGQANHRAGGNNRRYAYWAR